MSHTFESVKVLILVQIIDFTAKDTISVDKNN